MGAFASSGLLFIVLVGGINAFSLSYKPDTSPTTQRFLEFLEEEECEGIGAVEIGFRNGLRGIFAAEAFAPDDYIFAVPFVSCILVHENVYDMADPVESGRAEASDVEKGRLMLQWLHDKPHWQPYYECLPTMSSNFDATPDFWDTETIRQLEVPQLVEETLAIKRATESSLELQLATWLVRSRAFSTFKLLPNADEKRIRTRTVLIPFMDFLNHNAVTSNARIEKVEAKSDEESFFALVATERIPAGEQITITYGTGHETTLDLFTKYGFWTNDNANDLSLNLDEVQWSSSMEEDEQLRLSSCPQEKEIGEMLNLRIHLKRIQRQQQRKR